MDDQNTFERQLAIGLDRLAGPPRPVDAMAVARSVTTQSSKWGSNMFSALKLVAAAAIVALFGGFLLAGISTTQQGDEMAPAAVTESPSPMTTEMLPSGMVTEEVEPGVLRVVNDGVRDIAVPGGMWGAAGLSIDQDGDIWVHGEKTAYRLGEPAEPGWTLGRSVVDITSDGTLWGTMLDSTISSFDGTSWTDRATLEGWAWVIGIATTPAGTTWATTVDNSQCPKDTSTPSCRQVLLVRIDATGASTSPGWEGAEPGQLQWHKPIVSPDGDVWLVEAEDPEMEGCSVGAFRRYDGTEWQTIDVPEELTTRGAGESFGFGADGTLWAASGRLGSGRDCMDANHGLARLDESGWSLFTQAEGVRPWGGEGAYGLSTYLRVAPDGSVWVAGAGWDGCHGVARFDGASWTPYLEGYCVDGLDITSGGTVLALASANSGGSLGLYVITPEAVAATE